MPTSFSHDSYTSTPIITRPHPSAVIYDLSSPDVTTITLPPRSTWSSELHWHERHTEYLRVLKGSVHVRLDNHSFVVTAPQTTGEEAIVRVDVRVRHEWKRADANASAEKDEEEVIVIESTEPVDLEKRLFFWNLNGAILEAIAWAGLPKFLAGFLIDWRITLHLFVIFGALDNYPVFLDVVGRAGGFRGGTSAAKTLEALLTHAVLSMAGLLGAAIGMRAVEKRFTPTELYSEWVQGTDEKHVKKRT